MKARFTLLVPALACAAALAVPARSADAPAPAAGFIDGPGKAQTEAACSGCHAPGVTTGKRLGADEWAVVVDQMIGRGAKVSDADYDVIVDYLARNYGT